MKGWDVNERDVWSMTPLMWAARYGREEVVKLLLEQEHIQTSVPNRPVRTIVRTIGRQSGQSGRSFKKPRPVRPEPQKPTDA